MPNGETLKILRTGADDSARVDSAELTPLVHVHVPKCAGTTLDHALLAVALACGRPGFRFLGTIYGQGFSGLGKPEARERAEGFRYPRGWLFASGHIPYGRFPRHDGGVNEVALIRDPLARLVSMFRMGVARGAWSATTAVKDLFEAGLFTADSMVRQLSGEISPDGALDTRAVAAALGNFERLAYKGRIEDFDAVLAAILADYRSPYVAYQRFQVGEPAGAADHDRLAAQFAPYMELDKAFFERATELRSTSRKVEEMALGDVPPSAPVLLASPHFAPESGKPKRVRAAFVTAEFLARTFDS